MFVSTDYNENKLKLELKPSNDTKPFVYEPVIRKMGGVWNSSINGWLFEKKLQSQVDDFMDTQNSILAEQLNKEFYTKFGEEPDNYNTPSSTSTSSDRGMNEAYDLIQELFDRVTDLEKITEEHSKRLNMRR